MLTDTLDHLNQTMEAQLLRDEHPDDFPYLPPVPSSRYTDAGFAKLEHDGLWMKTWLLAGHVSELPGPGSYFLFQQLGQSASSRTSRISPSRKTAPRTSTLGVA